MFNFQCIFLSISSRLEGALLKDALERGGGSGACGLGGRALRTREALGNRPGPLRGAAFNGWTRQVKGGETCLEACARKHGPGDRNRRDGTSRGFAVCL